MNPKLHSLQRKLERQELEHLRRHVLELHQRLEQAEEDARQANEEADILYADYMRLQEAFYAIENCVSRGTTNTVEVVVGSPDDC